jgi:comEA protein
MKRAFFPLISLAFIIACAVFVYLSREAAPAYVHAVVPVAENDVGRDALGTPVADVGTCPTESQLININTASLEELMTLQGIGPAIGQRIIDYREDSGRFMAVEEIMEVSGIGEVVFGNIKDSITV